MASKKILMMMSGSIAAYKACGLISRLVQNGFQVQVAASESVLKFIGAATLEGLSGRPVARSLWDEGRAMDHIHLVRQADLVIAAPASAHLINRMAYGIGDDLLTTLFLAHDLKKPFLIAPAMNTKMYLHPTTQTALQTLKSLGVQVLETASGVLACGESGYGKLLEPDLILKEIEAALPLSQATSSAPIARRLRVLITSGGTKEPLDDVRVLTNTSTGRSGASLADRLSRSGFPVTLLRAQDAVLAEDPDVDQKTYVTHADLKQSLLNELKASDYTHVIHMAAVSDFQFDRIELDGQPLEKTTKIPSGQSISLKLKPAEKILPLIKPQKPVHVAAFKLTSQASPSERRSAMEKLLPAADVVISNDLSEMREGRHPYQILDSQGNLSECEGPEQLASWFSHWILEKET